MLYGLAAMAKFQAKTSSLNPYFFGKCSTATLAQVLAYTLTVVLILIFLENALRLDVSLVDVQSTANVLILIFLENALRQTIKTIKQNGRHVLILIFLENALRPIDFKEVINNIVS